MLGSSSGMTGTELHFSENPVGNAYLAPTLSQAFEQLMALREDYEKRFSALYSHFTPPYPSASCSSLSTGTLIEHSEKGCFYSDEYWNLFTSMAKSDHTWRSQNVMLLNYLRWHRDRLVGYTWSPREAFFVGWSLYHMQGPMRKFLVWSLRETEENEEDVTIDIFGK